MTRVWLLIVGALATLAFATIVLVVIPKTMLVDVPRPAQLTAYTPEEARGRVLARMELDRRLHRRRDREPRGLRAPRQVVDAGRAAGHLERVGARQRLQLIGGGENRADAPGARPGHPPIVEA